MAWPDLDLSRCPNTAEVQDAIARGILHLRHDLPPISLPADRCWTRADYEYWIYCDPLAVSIIPAEQLMTKSQMQNFAEVPPPPYPMDFLATHDIGLCPTLRVTLTWSNAGHLEEKVLSFSVDGGPFQHLDTVGVSQTSYLHFPNVPGTYVYRIRWASAPETRFAQAGTGVVCPI